MKEWVKTILSASSFELSLLLHHKTFPQEFFKIKLDRSETTPSSGITQSTLSKHLQSYPFPESKVSTITVALKKREYCACG